MAIFSLLFAGLITFSVTQTTLTLIAKSASREWNDTLNKSIKTADLTALQEQVKNRRFGLSIMPKALLSEVRHGQIEAVILLVKAGADVQQKTMLHDELPLTTAIACGATEGPTETVVSPAAMASVLICCTGINAPFLLKSTCDTIISPI